jgi:hypothetical protein
MNRDKVTIPTENIVDEVLLPLQDRLNCQGLCLHEYLAYQHQSTFRVQNSTPKVILGETPYNTLYL